MSPLEQTILSLLVELEQRKDMVDKETSPTKQIMLEYELNKSIALLGKLYFYQYLAEKGKIK